MYKAAWSLLAFFTLVSCNSGGSGDGTGGAAGAGGGVGGASGAGGAGGAVGGSGGDAGVDAEGGGAVGGTGGAAGDAGPACNGPDFASCLIVESDGSGACHEGSGFQGPQKAVFDQTCTDSNGVLGTAPCSHAYPNVGGCSQPSTFCWVVWGLMPDDPSTDENEFTAAKAEEPNACKSIGGTYYAP